MEFNIILLVLSAALLHAVWNASVKFTGDPLISICGITVFGSFAAMITLPFIGWPDITIWPWLLVSIILHTLYFITLSSAYQCGDYSLVYPVARGTAPVFIALASLFVLNDNISNNQWIGIIGIITGVGLYAFHRLERMMDNKKCLLLSILTAMIIASYSIFDGLATRAAVEPFQFIFYSIFLEFIPILLYTRLRRGPEVYQFIAFNWKTLIPSGVMAAIGFAIVMWAMSQAPIVLVTTLRDTSIIFAALIGMFYFKESGGWRRIVAAILIFVSVVFMNIT
jgi:drug/metabolite transporter (DMT)-like permease